MEQDKVIKSNAQVSENNQNLNDDRQLERLNEKSSLQLSNED